MSIIFQVKRVVGKIYSRRKLIANVWKMKSSKPLVILKVTDPKTNIRTVHNLLFYLEARYFVAVSSPHFSFWLKFFSYLVPFKSVTVNPLMRSKASGAVRVLQTSNASNNRSNVIEVALVDQPGQLSSINVPYFKHPGLCWPTNNRPVNINHDRNGWIFFAGNTDPVLYDNPRFEAKYKIPGRYKVYQYLLTRPEAVTASYFNKEHVAETKQLFIHTLAGNNLPQPAYLEYLQQFNCMVCAPGVTMPLCHNIIEAMEFGCIPIFSYPSWLPAGLVHGINCFIYSDINELAAVIESAKSFSNERFSEMRQQLAIYYRRHFIDFNLDVESLQKIVVLNENKQMID